MGVFLNCCFVASSMSHRYPSQYILRTHDKSAIKLGARKLSFAFSVHISVGRADEEMAENFHTFQMNLFCGGGGWAWGVRQRDLLH